MILEIFKASIHSVGTAITMTAAGVYLHRRGMITSETKTGMARYTQQIAIPALFFTKIVDCPQNFSHDQCPNILSHLGDAWVLLVWPIYVLGVGLLVGYIMIKIVQPPKWQHNCVLAATAFANAMGMPITLLDVIGHNFVPPGPINHNLDPTRFQSIYVILNPVLQWGLGGWLLSKDEEEEYELQPGKQESFRANDTMVPIVDPADISFGGKLNSFRNRRKILSFISLEEAGYASESTPPSGVPTVNEDDNVGLEEAGYTTEESTPLQQSRGMKEPTYTEEDELMSKDGESYGSSWQETEEELGAQIPPPIAPPAKRQSSRVVVVKHQPPEGELWRILKKIASKAMQPPAIGAILGFLVASYAPLRGLFVDMEHRADNAPLEWIFDGVLTLAESAIPVNMCVVGVNLDIASQRKISPSGQNGASAKTIAAVVLGKMLIMPIIGITTVWILKTYFWDIPQDIQFQFYLVLAMNFITPTANVVMVIAELGSGPDSKNVMASLIGWQYVAAPFLLSLTVMLVVWVAVM
ncbi:expressed unknown protein [Seminavis robusta]|uniref:Auxin efflux carrier n=1 Tax=Seminavis robusta TaxID=568900 RepID=A0A9N8EQ60_9STRA|nr:expressed unknown protein [Seminavis robusta]|eukprot:Sro1650_g288720.1 n/a (525) ;mRNA; f:21559-23219